MASVFISYSTKNAMIVDQIIAELQRAGVAIWVAHHNLIPGTSNWDAAIRQGISHATHVLYIASPEAIQSDYVVSELHIARDQGKTIIPLWIAGDLWSSVMPLGFVAMQGIDARGNTLGTALQQVLQQLGQPSMPSLPSQLPPHSVAIALSPRLAQFGFVNQIINNIAAIIPPLIAIPAGPFLMGSDRQKDAQASADELPQNTVTLGAYLIAQFPLTVAEYACFVRATKHREPANWQTQQNERPDHPVVNISWHDALAYVQWFAMITGQPYRVPSEAEWEKAARGTDGRIYPWGDQWDKAKANTFDGGPGTTTPIGSYPQSASPYDALDMAGNVWEWTSSIYQPYPYRATADQENVSSHNNRVLRGGSGRSAPQYARAASRLNSIPAIVYINGGVRVACGLVK
jgi:toxoflavin biosynthesis protein ToxD